MSDIRFTEHAITRYIQFHTDASQDDAESRKEARRRLETSVARRLDQRTPLGDAMWVVDALGCRLVTKQDGHGDDYPHVCVTILPSYEREYSEHELAVIQERIDAFHVEEERLRQEQLRARDARRATEVQKELVREAELRIRELDARLAIVRQEAPILVIHAKAAREHAKVARERCAAEARVRQAEEKTARTALHREVVLGEKRALRAALRVALRFLLERDSASTQAALDEVAAASSGVLSSRFFDRVREEARRRRAPSDATSTRESSDVEDVRPATA